jgi:acetyl esterase
MECIEYTRAGGVRLALDASVPPCEGPCPAVIVVHGGGWVRGDRRTDVEPLLQPLYDAGFAWFSISYRMMEDPLQFGAAVQDVEAAIRWVKSHAREYGIDPQRIALVGESAGGQLAAMAALRGGKETAVRGVVALYAPMDLASLVKDSNALPPWIAERVRGTFLEGLLMSRLKMLSPVEHVSSGMPPFLLIHGTTDPLVPFEQSRTMCDKMRAAGASCELLPLPGAGHGLRWWDSATVAIYQREMLRWLKERLA